MKTKKNYPYLFQLISPFYGWFYKSQKRRYTKDLKFIMEKSILKDVKSVIDIGCGTGALTSAIADQGFITTGMDPVGGMLRVARKKTKDQKITYIQENIINGLDIKDNFYDASAASYVAHGLKKPERIKMYQEMKRISKYKVLIFDYNQKRNIFSDVIEFIEGGDYFNFIKDVKTELKDNFKSLTIYPLNNHASLYVCEI